MKTNSIVHHFTGLQDTALKQPCHCSYRSVSKSTGAFFYPQNSKGNTPIHLICENGHSDVLKLLLSAFREREDFRRTLPLQNGTMVGQTQLHFAVNNSHPGVVVCLVNILKK